MVFVLLLFPIAVLRNYSLHLWEISPGWGIKRHVNIFCVGSIFAKLECLLSHLNINCDWCYVHPSMCCVKQMIAFALPAAVRFWERLGFTQIPKTAWHDNRPVFTNTITMRAFDHHRVDSNISFWVWSVQCARITVFYMSHKQLLIITKFRIWLQLKSCIAENLFYPSLTQNVLVTVTSPNGNLPLQSQVSLSIE